MFLDFVKKHHEQLKQIALGVRILSMDAVLHAKSGHCGLPLGGAEMGTFLYFACMNYNQKNLQWFDRDRFVLSAGHGSMLQYSLLHFAECGLSIDDIKAFRQLNSRTPGHPEYGHTPGVEYTTGPLGQGLAGAVGMAIAERMLAARVNTDHETVVDHRTYVIAGDGCLMEGVTSEACSLAGHLKLSKLIVLYDANNITIDGTVDIAFSENVAKRYEAYGWNVFCADGNDFLSLAQAMDDAHKISERPNGQGAPSLIICKTIVGKGSEKWAGKSKIHGNPMSLDDVNAAKKYLGVQDTTPFFVPQQCYQAAHELLAHRVKKSQTSNQAAWDKFASQCPSNITLSESDWSLARGKMATRVASGKILAKLAEKCPQLVGGSADLAGSTNTTIPNSSFITAHDFSGRNIHFGVREHAMAGICNGLTVHGGMRAYCSTFAVFSDYMRPAIRIAALMNIPTLFILTHDSFAVGEDGPTHQPVEHHAALRCIPDLNVYRPADAMETFAAWEYVMNHTGPSCFLLTRQDVNDLNVTKIETVRHAMDVGGYIVKDFSSTQASDSIRDDNSVPAIESKNGAKKMIFMASGSEVDVVLKSAEMLENANLEIRVVSVPNINALISNPLEQSKLFSFDADIFVLDAGSRQNFAELLIGHKGKIFSLDRFGLSAPYGTLAQCFGFTVEEFCKFVQISTCVLPSCTYTT